MKWIASTLSAFVFLGLLTLFPALRTRRWVIDHTLASIVRIEFDTENGLNVCSGFLIDSHEALTAEHCVPDFGTHVKVDGLDAETIMYDEELALVSVPVDVHKPFLKIRTKGIAPGTPLITFGFGYGEMQVFARNTSNFKDGMVMIDGPLIPGMSGGPAVDLNGEVIGVNEASSEEVGVLEGQEDIRTFLATKR